MTSRRDGDQSDLDHFPEAQGHPDVESGGGNRGQRDRADQRPTQMLSIRLKEKWHAIIATAGAARLTTARRSGPTVSRPGRLTA